jgi:hypothetical protein
MVGRCVSREHLLTVWCPRLIGCGGLGSQSWQDAEGQKQGLSAPFRRARLRPAAADNAPRFRQGFREAAFSDLLLLRLSPISPSWLVNLAPRRLGVSFPTYVATANLGIIPGSCAFAPAGNGLDSVIEAQQAQYQSCLAKMGAGGQESCSYAPDPRFDTGTDCGARGRSGPVAFIPVAIKWYRRTRA